jgi:hypothetical protein
MRRLRPLLAAAALAATAACTPFTLVAPERQTVGGVISVQPGMKWNKLATSPYRGNVEAWTLDGPALNTLVFFTGVPDGEPLFTRAAGMAQTAQQEKSPVFRSSMNPVEVQELKPVPIANGQGFRFETRMIGRDEVERDGVFVGTVRGGKLYGAWFQGAKLHYFKRYLPEFDRLVASAQLVGEAAR